MAAVRIVALAALGVACKGSPDHLQSRQEEELLARGIDTRVSTYKDPQPPKTSPTPGVGAAEAEPAQDATSGVRISGRTRNEEIPGLRFRVPVEWSRSSAPQTTFVIPGPGGDAELVVYRFGDDDESLAKFLEWRAQFSQAEGRPRNGASEVQAMVRGPLRLTLVDMPASAAERVLPGRERRLDADARLLGVIVEGGQQHAFLAAIGPAATMALWEQAFADFATTFVMDFPP
ncbi:hypothetical protein SAMN02745121_08091 [Nannocystis exedens]|uniref:Lipoprotein n=1 Tax=Nannocystis exedens TaxID=54 RepID=A0A1I2HPK8_9BACT|nr:hypothetical protein [Nannocystis exedens]PCC69370.1 hypothetical protein NAEX_02392 [Nannocystis exedens]SFF31363.1 hypothetical protein SAMN02745121_08091 [Nannocystis exedens]